MKDSPLIVTRGDGVPLPDQAAALEEFKRQCLRPEPASSVRDLQKEVFEFAEKTFGPGREDAAWKKLFEELGEVLKDPRSPGEWGDVFILLLDLATIYGVDVDEATRAKLAVIAQRVWNRTETGTFQHVPGAVKPPELFQHRAVFEGGPWHGTNGMQTTDPEVPSAFRPGGLGENPGCYVLQRKDRSMDKQTVYVFKWDSDMEAPF